ncbi:MAG TPA: NUDIX hydrolase [Candidatus Paceibacterota bacterium]|nr:NUDIX hydrolase [Candidatus Paceibacterota bacterium]
MSKTLSMFENPKVCNHTSVGVILTDSQGRILLIDRKRFPLFFACPAGHLEEGEQPEAGAIREAKEEIGFAISNLQLVQHERYDNPCRRQGGTWHEWWIYRADFSGALQGSPDETKSVGWYDRTEIQALQREAKLEPIWQQVFEKLHII